MSWPKAKLGEVCVINPRLPKDTDESQNVSFLTMSSVSEKGLITHQETRVLSETKKGFTYFERNDILLAKITPCFENGKAVHTSKLEHEIGYGSTEFHVLRPVAGVADGKYIFYLVWNDIFRFHGQCSMRGAAGQKRVTADYLKQFEIPLPPLSEQQKIAAILDAADQLRQKDQQLIEHYTALGQSLFLEMFGDPVSNPKGWAKSSAEDHIDLLTGYAFKSNEYSNEKDDIHLCGGLIITPDGIDWEKANYWSRDKLDGLERYRVVCGDIVMAMDRPWISNGFKIHKITPDDKESLLVQRTARIRGKGIDQTFLYFLYKHPAFERQASTTETTVPHISPKDIRKYEFILPPIELQKKFAQGIEAIEQQKQQAQAALEKSDTLFNSLLQRAFKGELTQSTVT